MGQEIVYCDVCGSRLTGSDFEKGRAVRAGHRVLCSKCLPSAMPSLSPEERQELVPKAPPRKTSTSRIPTIKSPGTSSLLSAVRGPSRQSPTALYVGIGIAALVLLLIGLMTRSPAPMLPADSAPIARPTPPPASATVPVEDPVILQARDAIAKARARTLSAPNDLDAQLAAWEEAARLSALTPFFREASAGLQSIRERKAALAAPPVPVMVPVPAKPPVPAPTPEADPPGWPQALKLALAGDLSGAASALDGHPDSGQFRRMKALQGECLAALPKLPRGEPLRLVLRDGRVVEGPAVRIAPLRGEIGTEFVEWTDVSPASFAAIPGSRGPDDRRTLAYLCLLEGDRAGFEALRGPDPVPERWLKIEGRKPAPPGPRELEARARFHAAEREYAKPESAPGGAAKYKALLDEFGDTAFVKSDAERIRSRAESFRDYLLTAASLRSSGSFSWGPAPKSEGAWIARADGDSWVEADFVVLAELPYRAWAYVGGCCAESFTFYLQASDATDVNPKTKQREPIEPGGPLAALVKQSLYGLKKTHAAHLPKIPKAPTRWEWISIPLPKYAAGGPKKIRLIGDQQGFAVGAIAVSATRSTAPTDAELKRASVLVPEGLVGWWKLDGTAQDFAENGHHGVLKGSLKTVPGRLGEALHFEEGAQVDVTGTIPLPNVTISLWVKHDALDVGIQRYVTLGGEEAVLRTSGERHVHFYVKLDGMLRQIECQNVLEVGKWTHLVGSWDGQRQRVYKDGVLLHALPATGKPAGSVGNAILGVAVNEWLRGALDDVRVYDRALSDEEVKRLYGELAPGAAAEPAVVGKPWRAIFDGKTLNGIHGYDSWTVDGGALVLVKPDNQAAQSTESFGDGEVRVRFEATASQKFTFRVRQGGEGWFGVRIEDQDMAKFIGKPHEFVFVMKGDAVAATLDGKPYPVQSEGAPRHGRLQFFAQGRGIRILAIDVRD